MITFAEIDAAKTEQARVLAALAQVGRDVYHIRTGDMIGGGYGFSSYYQDVANGDDTDGPAYPEGTPIIHICFYHRRWEDETDVIVPLAYLDGTNAYLETEKADTKNRILREREREAEQTRRELEQREQSRRAQYEALKLEFEGNE